MITWEVHSMSEMSKDLQEQFPDYEKTPICHADKKRIG